MAFFGKKTKLNEEQLIALLVHLGIDPKELEYKKQFLERWSNAFSGATYEAIPHPDCIDIKIVVDWARFHQNDGTLGVDFSHDGLTGNKYPSGKDSVNRYKQEFLGTIHFKK